MAPDVQPPQPGPSPAGAISPDGLYIWNGTQWVPNAPATPLAAVTKTSHTGRNLGIGGAVALVLLLIIGIVAAAAFARKPTTVATTITHSPSPSPSPVAPTSKPTADASTLDGGWFTATDTLTGGGAWDASRRSGDPTASFSSIDHKGRITYNLTPVAFGSPSISVSGPDMGFPGKTVAEAAGKLVKNICKGPATSGSSTIGGEPALGYKCTDTNGKTTALAVWLHDGFTFIGEYSSRPADFDRYSSIFDEVLKSFQFSEACSSANSC
jgi:hypothetical protein